LDGIKAPPPLQKNNNHQQLLVHFWRNCILRVEIFYLFVGINSEMHKKVTRCLLFWLQFPFNVWF
jgi:hypothetical protein